MNTLLRRGAIALALAAAPLCYANNWPTSAISSNKTTMSAGEQVEIYVSANDVDGNLRYVNVDQTSPNAGYYGAGYDFDDEYPPGGAAYDIGSNQTNYMRTLTLTINSTGTFVFIGMAADSVGSGWQPSSNSITITVNAATAPTITSHPQSQAVNEGFDVVFGVTVSGTAPFTYQWKKNGANITGATGATLALLNISSSDAAGYSVVVSNSAGNAASNSATLTVTDPNADSDGDGIPDLTETALGTSSSTTTNDSVNTQQQNIHRPTS